MLGFISVMLLHGAAAAAEGAGQQTEIPAPSGVRRGLVHARPECQATTTLSGTMGAKKDDLLVDFTQHTSKVWVTHKVDIDAHEDQCISEVLLTTDVMQRGCEFRLLFRSDGTSPDLQLIDARLEADSFCPGWPDDKEGSYLWRPTWNAPRLTISRDKVPDRTADRSCVRLQMGIDGDLPMAQPNGKAEFAIHDLVILGVFDSVGDTQAVCPAERPPPSPSPPVAVAISEAEGGRGSLDVAVGGSFSQHHYRQEATILGADLYDHDVTFGGGVTGPSSAAGIDLTVRYGAGVWGIEGAAALDYGPFITLPEFGEALSMLTDDVSLVGVLRRDNELFRPAARAGWSLTALTVFNQTFGGTTDAPTILLETNRFLAQAGSIGLELGVGRARGLNGWLKYDAGFSGTYFSSSSLGLEVSVPIANNWSVRPYHKTRMGSWAVYGDNQVQLGVVELTSYRFGLAVGYSM